MIRRISVLIIIFSITLTSCNNSYRNETKVFKEYLKINFREKLPDVGHTYILISTFRCKGCVEKTLSEINEKVKDNRSSSITILTNDLEIIPNDLTDKSEVLFDAKAKYENIGLPLANITLIKTSNGKISKIQVINLNEIKKIISDEFIQNIRK